MAHISMNLLDEKNENTDAAKMESKMCKGAHCMDWMIYSKFMKLTYVFIMGITIGFIIPSLINSEFKYVPKDRRVPGTCHILLGVRTNCFPDKMENVDEKMCKSRGCCYQPMDLLNAGPVCHRKLPSIHNLNVSLNTADAYNHTEGQLKMSYPSMTSNWPPYTPKFLSYKIRKLSEGHYALFIYDPENEPDVAIRPDSSSDLTDINWSLTFNQGEDSRWAFRVFRKEEKKGLPILDMSFGSIILSKYYTEFSLRLPTAAVYGLGGHPLSFNFTHNFASTNFTRKLLYNLDPKETLDQEHSNPVMLVMQTAYKYSGFYLETSGSPVEMEVMPGLMYDETPEITLNHSIFDQAPLVVFRSLSSYILLHLFTGPEPSDVISSLTNHIGRPLMPPIWSLGLQLCRNTDDDLAHFDDTFQGMMDRRLPFDSDCISHNMLRSAFVRNPSMEWKEQLQKLMDHGKKFVLMMPPHVENFEESSLTFVRTSDDEVFVTDRNGEKVALPNFKNVSISSLSSNLSDLLKQFRGHVSGIQFIENSPYIGDFKCQNASLPFLPKGENNADILQRGTFCLNMKLGTRTDSEVHNSYAKFQMSSFKKALSDLNASVYLRTSHSSPGIGSFGGIVGSHFLPTWSGLAQSIREVLELGLSGSPFVSMTACGVMSRVSLNSTMGNLDELCLRWYQVAAFMPGLNAIQGAETHSTLPYIWTNEKIVRFIRRALQRRIKLVPYMYTQMFLAMEKGVPLVQPIFMHFPDSTMHAAQWRQFLFGSAIMVTPILRGKTRLVDTFFSSQCSWYDLWSGVRVTEVGRLTTIEAFQDHIPVHLRGGHIVPILNFVDSSAPNSTYEGLANCNHSLIVALSCIEDGPRNNNGLDKEECYASGAVLAHFDAKSPSGSVPQDQWALISLEVTQSSSQGELTIGRQALKPNPKDCIKGVIATLIIYGSRKPLKVSLADGSDLTDILIIYQPDRQRLQLNGLKIDWCNEKDLKLIWTF